MMTKDGTKLTIHKDYSNVCGKLQMRFENVITAISALNFSWKSSKARIDIEGDDDFNQLAQEISKEQLFNPNPYGKRYYDLESKSHIEHYLGGKALEDCSEYISNLK